MQVMSMQRGVEASLSAGDAGGVAAAVAAAVLGPASQRLRRGLQVGIPLLQLLNRPAPASPLLGAAAVAQLILWAPPVAIPRRACTHLPPLALQFPQLRLQARHVQVGSHSASAGLQGALAARGGRRE